MTWLVEYSGGDNRLDCLRVLAGEYEPVQQALMYPLIKSAHDKMSPVILPYWDGSGIIRFYAADINRRGLEELRLSLSAALGGAYTRPEYQLLTQPSNHSEKVLLEQFPDGVLRIDIQNSISKQDVHRVFRILVEVLGLYQVRPAVSGVVRRPVGLVLRDFMLACHLQDGVEARKYFNELHSTGSFSALNLLSLEIQSLAAERNWSGIIDHPGLTTLLGWRLSQGMLLVLLRAAGELGLNGLIYDDALAYTNRDCLAEKLAPLEVIFETTPLFEKDSSHREAWQQWAIGCAVFGRSDFYKELSFLDDDAWIRRIAAWAGVIAEFPSDASVTAGDSVPNRLPPEDLSPEGIHKLLVWSLNATRDDLATVWERLQRVPAEILDSLRQYPLPAALLREVEEIFSPRQQEGWAGWFRRLLEAHTGGVALEVEVLDHCEDWASESFDEALFCGCLRSPSLEAHSALRHVLPRLMDWLEFRQISCRPVVWLEMLELVALDPAVNPALVTQAAELTGLILQQPFTRDEYERLLGAIALVWESNQCPKAYPAMLELLDLLLDSPCPDRPLRRRLWEQVQGFVFQHWQSIRDPYLRQLTLVMSRSFLESGELPVEFSQCAEEDDNVEENDAFSLEGKVLGIYSLMEGAARRAVEVLTATFPGLRIELNSDHTATAALCHLAKTSHYFVFCSRSAKHQAFYPVTSIRKDIIYPSGTGASSIIREFIAAVDGR